MTRGRFVRVICNLLAVVFDSPWFRWRLAVHSATVIFQTCLFCFGHGQRVSNLERSDSRFSQHFSRIVQNFLLKWTYQICKHSTWDQTCRRPESGLKPLSLRAKPFLTICELKSSPSFSHYQPNSWSCVLFVHMGWSILWQQEKIKKKSSYKPPNS